MSAWTTTPPTEPGWYWVRHRLMADVMSCYLVIEHADGGKLGVLVHARLIRVEDYDSEHTEWQGPIRPEE